MIFGYQTDDKFAETLNGFQNIVLVYLDNIIIDENSLQGIFVCDVVADNTHIVYPNDKPVEMVVRFKKEAEDNFDEYAEAYKEVFGAN